GDCEPALGAERRSLETVLIHKHRAGLSPRLTPGSSPRSALHCWVRSAHGTARTGSRTQFEVFAALRNSATNIRGLHVRGENANQTVCTIRAELRKSSLRNFPKKRDGLIIGVARHCEFNRNPGLRNCSRF